MLRDKALAFVANPAGQYDYRLLSATHPPPSYLDARMTEAPTPVEVNMGPEHVATVSTILNALVRSALFIDGVEPRVEVVSQPHCLITVTPQTWEKVDSDLLGEKIDAVIVRTLLSAFSGSTGTEDEAIRSHLGVRIPGMFSGTDGFHIAFAYAGALHDAWLERRLPGVREPLELLEGLNWELDQMHLSMIRRFQDWLTTIESRSFGSLEANQRVTGQIQLTASRLSQAFACTKEGCGHPARLRCKPGRGDGSFVFEHTVDGKMTYHGGRTTFPALRLVREKRPDELAFIPLPPSDE
ncbi:MAG TPA: hypothetical protein VHR66_27920 [Gemmataceae bacterium]|jgi:hypothetical protein|nr:hypothetical protein [Gemmataceae bacterium]